MKRFFVLSFVILIITVLAVSIGVYLNHAIKGKASDIGGDVVLAEDNNEVVTTSSSENVISPNDEVNSNKEDDAERYILKENDGCIAIYRMLNENEFVLEDVTDILTKYLSEEDLIDLKDGISVVGIENLTHMLEDFE